MSRRLFSLLICGLFSCSVVGCDGGTSPNVIDTSNAEMSTEDDYASYDLETAEFSSGQE